MIPIAFEPPVQAGKGAAVEVPVVVTEVPVVPRVEVPGTVDVEMAAGVDEADVSVDTGDVEVEAQIPNPSWLRGRQFYHIGQRWNSRLTTLSQYDSRQASHRKYRSRYSTSPTRPSTSFPPRHRRYRLSSTLCQPAVRPASKCRSPHSGRQRDHRKRRPCRIDRLGCSNFPSGQRRRESRSPVHMYHRCYRQYRPHSRPRSRFQGRSPR